jgi:hypothetical protein
MPEHSDSNSSTDSSVTQLSQGRHDAPRLLLGALIGAAIGALVAFFIPKPRVDDEPPIRVKGGSIIFELLSASVYWVPREQGNKKKWKLSGNRIKPTYDYIVTVWYKKDGEVKKAEAIGDKIRVHYDQRWVELKAPNKKTMLDDANRDLELQADPTLLKHPNSIERILVNGDVVYQPSYGDFEEMIISHPTQ